MFCNIARSHELPSEIHRLILIQPLGNSRKILSECQRKIEMSGLNACINIAKDEIAIAEKKG